MFLRTEVTDSNNKVIKWYDTNGNWGKSTYDNFGRQISYEDYSGYKRIIEYEEKNIKWITNIGFIFHFIKLKKGYRILRINSLLN